MKCEKCGTEYKDTDRFCGMCGTPNPLLEVKPVPETPVSNSFEYTESDQAAESNDTDTQTQAQAYSFPDPTKPQPSPEPFAAAPETADKPEADNTAEASNISDISELSEAPKAEAVTNEQEQTEQPTPESPVYHTSTVIQDEPLYAGENKAVPQNKEPASSQPNIPKKSKQKLPKPQKEKRVCSLSAVVICIIIILILSVVCGVLGGLYLGERTKVRKMRQGSIIAPYSYSDFYNDK